MRRRFVSLFLVFMLLATFVPMKVLADEVDYPRFSGTLRTSEEGIAMIQELEGYIKTPIWDVAQNSIGYGCSTEYAKKYGFSTTELSKDEAHQLMLFVLDEMEDGLDKFLDDNDIIVNQYQYDALMSFTYNLGKGSINGNSRIGKLLKAGEYTTNEMLSAFGIYCHTGTGKNAVIQTNLVNRRIREAKLFLFGAYNFTDNNCDKMVCYLEFDGNIPGNYTDLALYVEDEPYGILFEADPTSEYAISGEYFVGWYDSVTGEKITAASTVTGDRTNENDDGRTVYPVWSDIPEDPELEIDADPYVCTDWLELTEKEYKDGVIVGSESAGSDSGEEDVEDIPEEYVEASDRFTDVAQDQWYYGYVNDLVNRGIINGYEDLTFRPNNTVTTGEALKMILLAAGFEEPEPVESHWARGYLNLALEYGIIDTGDITDLDVPITREMMAKVTANSLCLEPLYFGSAFSDTDSLYATILSDHGLSEGYEDGTFRPNNSLTRAELSTIVWRMDVFRG